MADLIENCRRHRVMIGVGLLTVLGALLLGVRAQQQELRLVGSDVTLVPKYTGALREITWELDDRILVEFVLKPQEEFIYDLTNDRMNINKTNGALTIRNLTTGDSGLYKAEAMANSIEYTEIRLTVRDCPDQPTISVESTEDQFLVSCESFSPDVTYEWFNPTTSVNKSQSYAEPEKSGTLTCVVDNEVCNKSSSINFYIPDQPEEKWVGYDVTLVPQYTGDPSEIIWKVNGYKLVEMVLKPQVDILFYRLKGRATISETDGRLTIRHLTMEDSGDYTAVVLVNNEYYYTEIRLECNLLSGWIIAVLVLLVLTVTPVLLCYCCYKKCRRPPKGKIAGILSSFNTILWYCCYKKSRPLSRVNFNAEKKTCRKEHSKPYKVEFKAVKDSDIERAEESERCITVMFWNYVISPIDESEGLLEGPPKRIQSLPLTIYGVQTVDDEIFTAEAVMSDGKEGTFTEGKDVKELVWKKDGVTLFEWAVSSLKFHASNLKLEPRSVTVYNAEGKESYKVTVYDAEGKESYIVFFRLEEPPESTSCCITFHPSNMTGKDKITWKKDSHLLNIGGNRIKCDPNGDLTIYNATSEDKGKYTVQCKDKKLDQEFILQF